MTNEKEIVVTPAFDHLFHTMIEEAIIQRFLAPLNFAAHCFTKRGEIERFREVRSQVVQDIDKTAAQLEADLAEVDLELMETPR